MEDQPREVSTEEALRQAGYNSLGQAMKRALTEAEVISVCSWGCWVEIDGECPHGFPSVIRKEGYV